MSDLPLSSEVGAPPFPLVDEGPPALLAEDLQTAGRVALVPRPAGLPTARRTRPTVPGAAVRVAVSLSGVSVTECVGGRDYTHMYVYRYHAVKMRDRIERLCKRRTTAT